jgi:outer membrane immunogenic protein
MWLLGVEADLQATGQKADLDGFFSVAIGDFRTTLMQNNHWNLPWFGTLRGRAGATFAETWLVYVTGGLAVGRAEFTQTTTATITTLGGSPVASATVVNGDASTMVGFAVGAGIEKAFDPHWRVKVEYLYVDLGSHTFGPGTFNDTIRVRDNIVRVGLNYRFLPN